MSSGSSSEILTVDLNTTVHSFALSFRPKLERMLREGLVERFVMEKDSFAGHVLDGTFNEDGELEKVTLRVRYAKGHQTLTANQFYQWVVRWILKENGSLYFRKAIP